MPRFIISKVRPKILGPGDEAYLVRADDEAHASRKAAVIDWQVGWDTELHLVNERHATVRAKLAVKQWLEEV